MVHFEDLVRTKDVCFCEERANTGREGGRKRARLALSIVPPSHIPTLLAAERFKGDVSPILPSNQRGGVLQAVKLALGAQQVPVKSRFGITPAGQHGRSGPLLMKYRPQCGPER